MEGHLSGIITVSTVIAERKVLPSSILMKVSDTFQSTEALKLLSIWQIQRIVAGPFLRLVE